MSAVKLETPIRVAARQAEFVNEITLRRPKARDIKAVGHLEEPAMTMELIRLLADPPLMPSEVDDLDGFDYRALSGAITGFLQSGPGKTGAAANSTSP